MRSEAGVEFLHLALLLYSSMTYKNGSDIKYCAKRLKQPFANFEGEP